jgi:hypothetical protein
MNNFRVLAKIDTMNKDILVSINGVDFNCDTVLNKTVMFWLTEDQADSLVFHVSTAIQEREKKRESDKLKAGEELRETVPLEESAE